MEFEKIEQSFNTSSEKNRNQFFFFVTLTIYFLIMISGTQDADLLRADKQFSLPVVNINLPVTSLYIFAPIMLVVLHMVLLINISEHLQLMDCWLRKTKSTKAKFPFLVNTVATIEKEGQIGLKCYVLKSLVIFGYLVLPLLTLLFFQVRFSDFHNIWITFYHSLILYFNVFFIFRMKLYKDLGIFNTRISYHFRILKWGSSLIIFLSVFNLMATLAATFFPQHLLAHKSSFYIPTISIGSDTVPSIRTKPITVEEFKKYTSNRSLRKEFSFIDLSNRELQLSTLTGLNLEGVNFQKSDLRGTNLDESLLNGSDFSFANLSYSTFRYSSIEEAIFHESIANNVIFFFSIGKDSSFESTQLSGASFVYSNFSGVVIKNSKLVKANMNGSKMYGANLSGNEMEFARLLGTDLSGSTLRTSNLFGANLLNTSLTGAYVGQLELNGVYFRKTNMSDCIINNSPIFTPTIKILISSCVGIAYPSATLIYKDTTYDYSSDKVWELMESYVKGLTWEEDEKIYRDTIISSLEKSKSYILGDEFDINREYSIVVDGPRLNHFKSNRRKLSCTNKRIARSIRHQNEVFRDDPKLWFDDGYDNYLKMKCPEKFEFATQEHPLYRY
jgi:uncharacterized protein YjbI with pentapeptide repeats